MSVILSLLAAALPPVPDSYVQLVPQGGEHVIRNLIDDSPVYTFDADSAGQSSCNDTCAQSWTPLRAAGDAKAVGEWTVIVRADGSQQWAFRGQPVYSFARDPEAVTLPDGRVGNWHQLPAFGKD